MMEFFNGRFYTAKKEHRCEACGDKIQIGERYKYESGKFEGEFFSRCYHTACSEVIEEFWFDIDDDEFTYDEIRDWWEDKYCYQCALWYDNGGECECDMDKRLWCTKYQKRS